ncbi:hypothetical protein [Enterovibrio norvegicus]|uniref:hypothetical protein n=1 Tax=Enterovibrio norvegicus TaxID=188144 RepID=UPI0002E9D71E|nr:hypothetical protein [Enterovibrio norvegicus]OEF58598.1 hypothetical protein A1OU_10565 [Enterovibrio norvegicus]
MNEFKISLSLKDKDVVSFDVFDTLVNRPFVRPSDVFIYINDKVRAIHPLGGNKFSDIRLRAEKDARIELKKPEVTMRDIYNFIQNEFEIYDDVIDQIIDLEVNAEIELSSVRVCGKRIYDAAIATGKKIIFISDMYLSSTDVKRILEKNGYIVDDNLYVSSDLQAVKHDGSLFDLLIEKSVFNIDSTVHIGDNYKSDYAIPSEMGIEAIHIPKAIEIFYKDPFNKKLWGFYINRRTYNSENQQLAISSHIQMCANELYKVPFQAHESDLVFRKSPHLVGYYGFGSLVFNFSKWIYYQAKLAGIEKLHFLSRDGLVLKQVFDRLMETFPESERIQSNYLLSSRRCYSVACITDKESLMASLEVGFKKCSLRNILVNKYGLRQEQLNFSKLKGTVFKSFESNVCCVEDKADLSIIIDKFSLEILENAKVEKRNLMKYLDINSLSENCGIVDIGYSGTLQKYLYKLTGNKIPAFYLTSFSKCLEIMKDGFQTYSYLDNYDDRHDTDSHWVRHLDMFEGLFSSSEGSLIRLDDKGNPITLDNNDEKCRNGLMSEIQRGCIDYSVDMISKFGFRVSEFMLSPFQSYKSYKDFVYNPNVSDALMFMNSSFDDVYGGHEEARSLLADPMKSKNKDDMIMNSSWKPGARIVSSNFQSFSMSGSNPTIEEAKINKTHMPYSKKESFKQLNSRRIKRFLKDPNKFMKRSKYKALNIISRVIYD